MALRLRGATSGYIELKAPASAGDNTLTLPTNNGSANQLLKTDGSGNLSWTDDNSGGSLSGSTDNTIATVTGANALAGEANLTWDGTRLSIGGLDPTEYYADKFVFKASDEDGITIASNAGTLNANENNYIMFASTNSGAGRYDGYVRYGHQSHSFLVSVNNGGGSGKNFFFESDGDFNIGDGNLVVGSGKGIDFSATADAGASASNIYEILDDYEEGYFTPNIQPVTSGSITWVGTADLLSYTKIGRIVHIKGMLEVDSVSSPTGITRGTLPFTQASLTDESERTSGVCIITGTNIAAGSYALYPNGGTDSYLEPIRIGNSADIERDVSSYLGAGDKLYFSYTYQASA